MTQKRTRIALFGENVSRSLSPFMHNQAFRHLRLPYSYEAISVPPQAFNEKFKEAGRSFLGLNITIPYKETVFPHLHDLSPQARKLEAVNTVLFEDARIRGENTDVDGFVQSVLKTAYPLDERKSAFILGAGGAARATVEALYSLGIKRFAVTTRSRERLSAFRIWFANHYSRAGTLETFEFSDLTLQRWKNDFHNCSIYVNAAPPDACRSMPFFPAVSFSESALVVDWVYLPRTTPWLLKGEQAKGTLVPGYKLLLYQGMKSFEIWTGMEAPEKIMENALMERLK